LFWIDELIRTISRTLYPLNHAINLDSSRSKDGCCLANIIRRHFFLCRTPRLPGRLLGCPLPTLSFGRDAACSSHFERTQVHGRHLGLRSRHKHGSVRKYPPPPLSLRPGAFVTSPLKWALLIPWYSMHNQNTPGYLDKAPCARSQALRVLPAAAAVAVIVAAIFPNNYY
jgi:hypothetical protein